MRRLDRREFLRLCGATGAALGLSQVFMPDIIEAFSGPKAGYPPVVWLQGGSCSGCSVSLLNSVGPEIGEVLTGVISLKFHQTLMAAAGEQAIDVLSQVRKQYAGQYYLVIEGTIPVASGGKFATLGEEHDHPVPFVSRVREMASDAKAIMAVGSCAAFGGIPAARPNPTGSKSVGEIVRGVPLVNVPGCPTHPDWVLGTLLHLIHYGVPDLDALKRPKLFYDTLIHDICERRPAFDEGHFAHRLSERGCLYKLGCKGPMTYADCPSRKFNNSVNWCVGANSPCLACVEPSFPDASEPFFVKMQEYGPVGTASPQPKTGRITGGGN